jgi:hypothetical protein
MSRLIILRFLNSVYSQPTDGVLWLCTIHVIEDVPPKMYHNFLVVCTIF